MPESESPLTIRLCGPDDTAQIVPLIQAQVAEAGQPAADPGALAELVCALLISHFSDFLLAEVAGRHLGVLQINYRLSTQEAAPYAVIEDFYLAPELRGRGAGARMLDYACARAQARGSLFVQSARPPGDPARRVYERLGFTAAPCESWRRRLTPGGAGQPETE